MFILSIIGSLVVAWLVLGLLVRTYWFLVGQRYMSLGDALIGVIVVPLYLGYALGVGIIWRIKKLFG